MIYKAIKFAEDKHKGQIRKVSGAPYVTHPINTSYLLAKFKRSKHIEELIAASILHDTLEDTETTFVELATEFSPLVASLVFELTSDEEQIKILGKNEYFKKKLLGISSYGLVLKLVDRLSNVRDNPKLQYIQDTIDLMNYISRKRKLTKSQKAIVEEILCVCEPIFLKGNP
jgi:(p)ppGpp synthase/HD superfamily hydrolase